jgi:hypothetical protein
MSKTFTLCPGCNQRVEPAAPGVIYAVPIQRADTMRGPQYYEGVGGYFHNEACFARVQDGG